MNSAVRRGLVGCAAGVLAATAAAAPAAAHDSSKLDRLRYATAPYFDIDEAVEKGFGELTDQEGIACIESEDEGAMGIHYVHGGRVGNARVRLLRPEALIYEPQEDGDMRLVAVEYVVFRSAWREKHPTGRPKLFGRRFELVKAGNRYGIPPSFALHVWAWQYNPAGRYADYNPRVSCEFAPPTS